MLLQATDKNFVKTVIVVWLTLSVASIVLAGLTWGQLSHNLTATRQAVAIQAAADKVLRALKNMARQLLKKCT